MSNLEMPVFILRKKKKRGGGDFGYFFVHCFSRFHKGKLRPKSKQFKRHGSLHMGNVCVHTKFLVVY